MIDLWTLLIVDLFQSFWMAVIALAFLIYIIFMIGRVSQYTSLTYISIFILAMALGYGYSLISILVTIVVLVLHLFALPRLINS
jgi:uncharacterized membrane protein